MMFMVVKTENIIFMTFFLMNFMFLLVRDNEAEMIEKMQEMFQIN